MIPVCEMTEHAAKVELQRAINYVESLHEKMKLEIQSAFRQGYLDGFLSSCEGYNAECPFNDGDIGKIITDKHWIKSREDALLLREKSRDALDELSKIDQEIFGNE